MKGGAKKHTGKSQKAKKRLIVPTKLLIAGVVVLFVLALCFSLQWWGRLQRERSDHLQPLVVTNLEYCNGEKLDLTVPQGAAGKPLVVLVHGGGWQYGSKVGGAAPSFTKLTESGIAVASINYRLSGIAQYPAQIHDVQCAVRFLKTNATLFGLDGNKVVLAGISSGANLALMAGLSDGSYVQPKAQYNSISSDVRGVVALSAHYNLTDEKLADETKENIQKYLGPKGSKTDASPINYLVEESKPLLLMHAKEDKNIPIEQARNFAAQAQKLGVDATLIEVSNANHNLSSLLRRDSPDQAERLKLIADFVFENTQ